MPPPLKITSTKASEEDEDANSSLFTMKSYLCLLKNSARPRIDDRILGIGSTYAMAIHICIYGVFTMASDLGKKYQHTRESEYTFLSYMDKIQEIKDQLDSEDFKNQILKQTESFYESFKEDDIKALNTLLAPQYKKMGKAQRWCEIMEIENDTFFIG